MKMQKIDTESLNEMERLTLPQILMRHAATLSSDCTAIREKAYGIWQTRDWQGYYSYVKKTGLGLKALGFERGEHLAIVMDNHQEWLFSELAGQALGGVTLNLFTSAVGAELAHGLNRAESVFVIAQDQEQVDKLLEVRDKIPSVRKVIYVDPTGMRAYDDPWFLSFRELLELGERHGIAHPGVIEEEIKKGKPNDIAVMIMTSGTTGVAKLAMLSHANFVDIARKWLETAPIGIDSNWLSISPPPWIVDQMWGLGVALVGAMTMNFPETPETVTEDFRELGPHVIITSSRFWEDLASLIRVKIADAGLVKRLFFSWAERIGGRVVDLRNEKNGVPVSLKLMHKFAALTVYRPLLDRVGCAYLKSAYTGGHPISPDVIRFFRSIGLNLKQCYGLTEASGIFQVQPDDEVKAETVGVPLPRTHVKISESGEVLVSSPSRFMGYHKDYEATKAVFDEGWLKTGDAGYIDDDGHLVIIGRKEEIIRDKEGRVFSPDFIETRLKFSPYIKEAVVFGEGRPYITAFINIDMGNVGNWAEDRMIPYTTYTDLSQQEQVEQLILSELRAVNERLPKPMRIRRFLLLYKLLDADDEELTRTGKVRRRFVYGLYLKLIEGMYRDEKEVAVKGKVHYRDGRTGTIETTVRILDT